jgi:hypothetical protein
MAGNNSNDVRAGGAFYELWGKDGLSGVLDKLQKRVLTFGSFMSRQGNKLSLLGAGLAAPLVALMHGAGDSATELVRLNRQTGIEIENLGKFQYAAEMAGVSIEEVYGNFDGRYSDLIAKAPPVDVARVKEAAEMQMRMKDASIALRNAMLPLFDTLVPLVVQFSDWAKQNAGLIRLVVPLAVGLLVAGLACKVLGAGAVVAALGIKVLAATVAFLASPLGIVTAAAAALTYVFMTQTEAGRGYAQWLKGGLVEALDVARSTWEGMSAALAKGDFALAGRIALAGLALGWAKLMVTLTTAWVGFKMTFVDGWQDAVAAVSLMANDLGAAIWKAVYLGVTHAGNAFSWFIRGALDGAIKLAEALHEVTPGDHFADVSAKLKGIRESFASTDPAAGVASIEAGRTAERDRILADRDKDAAARKEFRLDQIRNAMLAEKKAADELAALKGEALEPGIGRGLKGVNEAVNPFGLKAGLLSGVTTKGSFSGAALGQQLGYGDQATKQTELLKSLVDGKGGLPGEIGAAVGAKIAGGFVIR